VNDVSTGQQEEPALAVAGDGTFVVAWRDDADNDGNYQILARAFFAAGEEWLPDFALSAATGQHLTPALAMSPSGAFTAVWADDSDGNGTYQIIARSYNSDGSLLQDRFTVNRVAAGQQLRPGLSLGDQGTLVILWEDDMDSNGSFQLLGRGY
jgi:hypothetical protein